ncbi:MAG: LysM peptidoglycan-binding domain-containing protein [Firmicutes bacterium]|nr:LysM peptidoglycan-binding domain-containing protein [Bacillota bacterium]
MVNSNEYYPELERCTNCLEQCPENSFAYIVLPNDTLEIIAERFGISVDDLVRNNPNLNEFEQLEVYSVICVPQRKRQCAPDTENYIVQPGDSLQLLADAMKLPLEVIFEMNPDLRIRDELFPGEIICVPTDTAGHGVAQEPPQPIPEIPEQDMPEPEIPEPELPEQEFPEPEIPEEPRPINPVYNDRRPKKPPHKTNCPPNTFPYTVQKGDTMFSIAKRFNVPLPALIKANPQIPNPNKIFPGQIVCVPKDEKHKCPHGTTPYIVQQGDTMYLIAKRFNITLNALIAANPQVKDPNLIFPGQVLCIPKSTTPPPCPPGTFEYKVKPGDTMFFIAQRFGINLNTLIAANPQVKNPNLIFPGQILCVPKK